MVLGDNFPNILNPNMIFYRFNTSHMHFFQNEHVELNETLLDVQGQLKAYVSHVMNVFGRLTSKNNETINTSYK